MTNHDLCTALKNATILEAKVSARALELVVETAPQNDKELHIRISSTQDVQHDTVLEIRAGRMNWEYVKETTND